MPWMIVPPPSATGSCRRWAWMKSWGLMQRRTNMVCCLDFQRVHVSFDWQFFVGAQVSSSNVRRSTSLGLCGMTFSPWHNLVSRLSLLRCHEILRTGPWFEIANELKASLWCAVRKLNGFFLAFSEQSQQFRVSGRGTNLYLQGAGEERFSHWWWGGILSVFIGLWPLHSIWVFVFCLILALCFGWIKVQSCRDHSGRQTYCPFVCLS